VAEIQTKMGGFSHRDLNTADNRNVATIVDRVRDGTDLFGRKGELYDKVDNNGDVPSYISEQYAQNGKFRYLLSRDGEDAGFEDVATVNQKDV
jgi:beta-1,4-mannosyl-glycoprotein beta-1,4-N-acetylglucosaminyltransferase